MEIKNKEDIIVKINEVLEKVRPYLIADGGDVAFVELTQEFEVKVKLSGACSNCPFSMETLKLGIEQILQEEIPEIKSVFAV